MGIHAVQNVINLENQYVRIRLSSENAQVESVFDKVSGKEIRGTETCFFSLIASDKKTPIVPTSLQFHDGCFCVDTAVGSFKVKADAQKEYFTFELVSALPAEAYKALLAHVKYDYDSNSKENTGAIGIPMTHWANPCFYPDAKALETKAEVVTSLRSEGAKYALIIAPIVEHKEIIKKVCRTIDRNIAIHRRCDELRKQRYFPEEILQKVKTGPREYHIVPKDDGSYVFAEKDYQIKKLYDLCSEVQNKACFNNPFAAQKPFLRIEAMLSAKETEPQVLLALDKEIDLTQQVRECNFAGSIDLSAKLAKKVSICGNGRSGAVAIKMRAGLTTSKSYAEYIIDTDFEGWRDFILLESDNGERSDVSFESEEHVYTVHRYNFEHDHVTKIYVETTGDMTGVKMSDIVAVEHCYEVLKNPTVCVGESKVTFACELMSSDFIEFDGVHAKVIDRYGNEKPVYHSGELTVPAGCFVSELTAKPLNGGTARAQLTFGFTGQEIK